MFPSSAKGTQEQVQQGYPTAAFRGWHLDYGNSRLSLILHGFSSLMPSKEPCNPDLSLWVLSHPWPYPAGPGARLEAPPGSQLVQPPQGQYDRAAPRHVQPLNAPKDRGSTTAAAARGSRPGPARGAELPAATHPAAAPRSPGTSSPWAGLFLPPQTPSVPPGAALGAAAAAAAAPPALLSREDEPAQTPPRGRGLPAPRPAASRRSATLPGTSRPPRFGSPPAPATHHR